MSAISAEELPGGFTRVQAYVRQAAHHGRHIQRSPVSETARRDSDGSTTTQAEWSSLAVWRCVGIYTEQKKAVQVDALRFLQVTHCSGTVTVPESSITFDEPGLTSRFVPSGAYRYTDSSSLATQHTVQIHRHADSCLVVTCDSLVL
jgi:hypothetical protein